MVDGQKETVISRCHTSPILLHLKARNHFTSFSEGKKNVSMYIGSDEKCGLL